MKKMRLFSYLTCAALLAFSEGTAVTNGVSTGFKSALFRAKQQKSFILNSLGFNSPRGDKLLSNLSYDDETFDSFKTSTSITANVVNGKEYKDEIGRYGILIKGGGGYKNTQKNRSLLPPVTAYNRSLLFWENMICGAISRSIAQTVMHPANTMKTILQSRSQAGADRMTISQLAMPKNLKLLTRGAGAQFVLSVPHGAVNFAVLEFVRRQMANLVAKRTGYEGDEVGPGVDFFSSAISTFCCSVVSTPQMMITDNIMAGTYPNLKQAAVGLAKSNGVKGFYSGWWPGLVGKIPSYGLTWVFFQQLKKIQPKVMKRDPRNYENAMMGCLASTATVCIMIPVDTIKTRLVTQANYPGLEPYKGIIDCSKRILEEEGIIAFYRGLSPRLLSVVPMIGIQFGVYEFMKKAVLANNAELSDDYLRKQAILAKK